MCIVPPWNAARQRWPGAAKCFSLRLSSCHSILVCSQCNPCREGGGSEAVMSVIIVCLFIALIVMYWISLYSDRHLIRRIEVNDERRVLLHMRQGTSHFDQLAEERLDNAGKHADGVRPVGRPNLTYKMKIVLSFFQVGTYSCGVRRKRASVPCAVCMCCVDCHEYRIHPGASVATSVS